jgi:hypothetical protein
MRDKINWFVCGVFLGIFLSGSTPSAVAENIETVFRSSTYRLREWRREREIKKKQNP